MPFSDISGHDATVGALQRSLASGRIAHAYLFAGIEGCGKRMTALAFIQAVFCGREEACGDCPSCRKIAANQHPDLHLVSPDGAFIKIDQVRELQRQLSYRPFEAPKKACIIDDADRLNASSGNALLKTLEEPPGNALLILVSANPGGVLPTILSRCQQLLFRGVPQEHIERILQQSCIAAEPARLAAALAGGSVARALALARDTVLEERTGVLERLSTLSRRRIKPLFAAAEEFAGDKEKALTLLELLSTFQRDLLLLHGGSSDVANRDLLPLLEREVALTTPERVMKKIDCIAETRTALLRNVNTRLALDLLFMRLAH
jgi:DNA polymerase-3 subunit delta'